MSETATSSTSSPPVTWQTAVFLLIPLAISAMTQPSGRFLGAALRNRTYLRSIPLLCAGDTVLAFFHLVYFAFSSDISFRSGFDTYIQHRFTGRLERRYDDELRRYVDFVDSPEENETIQTLRDQMWTRWIYLGLGTIWPSLKLFGLGGVPWVIAWGVMFLSSIIMTEMLVLFGGWRLDRNAVHGIDVNAHQQMLPHDDHAEHANLPVGIPERLAAFREYPTGVKKYLEKAHAWIVIPFAFGHLAILLWAAWDLKPEPQRGLNILLRISAESLIIFVVAIIAVFALAVVWYVLCILLILVVSLVELSLHPDLLDSIKRKWIYLNGRYGTQFLFLYLFGCLMMYLASCVGVLWLLLRDDLFVFTCTLIDFAFFAVVIGPPYLLYALLYWGSGKSCSFGRKLLLMEECHCMDRLGEGVERRKCVVNDLGCILATAFLLTLILLFLWYPLKYDPSNTWVSSWPSQLTGN